MKVTAIIPDDLISRVKEATGGKNITESLLIALNAYLDSKKVDSLVDQLDKEPMQFAEGSAAYIRKINRSR